MTVLVLVFYLIDSLWNKVSNNKEYLSPNQVDNNEGPRWLNTDKIRIFKDDGVDCVNGYDL